MTSRKLKYSNVDKAIFTSTFFFTLISFCTYGQQFERIPIEQMVKSEKKIEFKGIATTSNGDMLITTTSGVAYISAGEFTLDFPAGGLEDANGNHERISPASSILKDAYTLHTGYKALTAGPGDIIYAVSDNNNLGSVASVW